MAKHLRLPLKVSTTSRNWNQDQDQPNRSSRHPPIIDFLDILPETSIRGSAGKEIPADAPAASSRRTHDVEEKSAPVVHLRKSSSQKRPNEIAKANL